MASIPPNTLIFIVFFKLTSFLSVIARHPFSGLVLIRPNISNSILVGDVICAFLADQKNCVDVSVSIELFEKLTLYLLLKQLLERVFHELKK